MNPLAALALAGIVLALAAGCGEVSGAQSAQAQAARLSPATAVAMADAPRFGLNLGGASTWGAEQLLANVVHNPGFEPSLERSLVIVKAIDGVTVTDDSPWVARPSGMWEGGDFDVRTGAAAGKRGRIAQYRRAAANGAGEFVLSPWPEGLRAGDGIAVTAFIPGGAVPQWWVSYGETRAARGEIRPGSLGLQSVQLVASPGRPSRLAHHLDTLQRGGKLLPVNGAWQLAFWARAQVPGTKLAVAFRRHGAPAFVQRDLVLDGAWRQYTLPFVAEDGGAGGPLELSMEVQSGTVFIDDVYLGAASTGAGAFRAEVVAVLGQLRPGYLRDWQGQLGDTWENRVAEASARRPTRYRDGAAEILYHYSLPEFLALCAAVDAQPWVIAPPLLGDDEWQKLGETLAAAARQHGFREVLVEFGNENWNALFRPAGFMAPAAHAAAFDRAMARLRAGAAGYAGIVPVINAQFVNTASWREIASLSREAGRIAVAPYFLHRLDQVSPEAATAAAFDDVVGTLREGISGVGRGGRSVSAYELNFHTTEGNASPQLRNLAVTGAHGGAALARQLLGGLLAGVREQAVYTLAGYDAYAADRSLVHLWGVTRDLAPGRLRPTGLALALLNSAIEGDAHAANCESGGATCGNLAAAYFRSPRGLGLAVASREARAIRVHTGMPCGVPVAVRVLDGTDPARNNESGEQVAVETVSADCEGDWSFELPARGVAVVQPTASARGERR